MRQETDGNMLPFDDPQRLRTLDAQDMLGEIERLPQQLAAAYDLGRQQPLDGLHPQVIRQVVIAGMGGSAIGGDLLAAYVATLSPLPVIVWRDYDLPSFARGPETLLIASSHSGNTEETLSALAAAQASGCQRLAICTGGALSQQTDLVWRFTHQGQPRAAVGYSFGLLLALFERLGLIPAQEAAIQAAVQAMTAQQEGLRPAVPSPHNPAKRSAGQWLGRAVTIFGQGLLAPVARRWKTQINELAKTIASFEFLPEADHNALAALDFPSNAAGAHVFVFLQADSDHPRNRLRSDHTRRAYMLAGLATDLYQAPGDSPLAQMWTAIHFGDYAAFYLAIANEVDPTPVEALTRLKQTLKDV